ncbi:hypothetical protein JB92DRAFT_2657167, partial [Gautieria morchelliformis]
QATEVLNPAFSQGLSPSVAATDPSLNYDAKASVVNLWRLLLPWSWTSNMATHAQSVEMHNQSVSLYSNFNATVNLDIASQL